MSASEERIEVNALENGNLFRSLSAGRTDVEIWDLSDSEGGWAYFSIVAFAEGTARILAYTRVKDSQIQKRTYDANGDDLWIAAD